MLFKKEKQFNMDDLLTQSEMMLKNARNGEFQTSLQASEQDEKIQAFIRNINEIHMLREEFEDRQQQKIDTLLQINKIGFWELDLEEIQFDSPKNKIIISPELQIMLGYNPGEIENNLHELVKMTHPDYAEAIVEMVNAHLNDNSGKTKFEKIHKLLFKSGEYRWVRTYGYAKRRPDGTPYRMIAIITDIHDEFMNRNELDAYITRYDLITEVLEEAPWDMEIKDGDPSNPDNVWWWSDQFRRTLGFKDEHDFPNKVNSWSDRLHPDDVEKTFETFYAHLNDYSGRTPFSIEHRLQLKNGEYRWFLANGVSARDENGVPTRIAGSIRDIQHIKMKTQTVAETTSRMEELAASISEMVNGITSIASQAQQLAATQEATTNSANDAKELAEQTKEISNFIKGIADQTNLLGLNAAIEAARAGEHGKGFGVVADEVRKLADNSSQATGKIEQSLNSMKNAIDAIIEQMNVINELAQAQAALAEQVNASVEDINNMSLDLVEFAKQS